MNEGGEWPVEGWEPLIDDDDNLGQGNSSQGSEREGKKPYAKEILQGKGTYARPTLIGVKEKLRYLSFSRKGLPKEVQDSLPRDIEVVRIESFDSPDSHIAVRRVGETGLEDCQDCFAVKVDANEGKRTVVVADGVGEGVAGGRAAEIVARELAENPDGSPDDWKKIGPEEIREVLRGMEVSEDLRPSLEQVAGEVLGASTAVVVSIEANQLSYRLIGDGGFIVVRPDREGGAKVIERRIKEAERIPPQLCCTTEGWKLRGEEEKGRFAVEEGDVVLMFTDGFLKQFEFSSLESSLEELEKTLVERIGRSSVMRTTTVAWAQMLADGFDFRKSVGRDDATLAVIVV